MRASGILMPIFSLPSDYGIGTFGRKAYEFIDFLSNAGQRYWQILPLNPTNFGDSPYQSFSSFAGNPYFINLGILKEDGLLETGEAEAFDFGNDEAQVDYGKLFKNREKVLKLAFSRFKRDDEYYKFCEENSAWLEDYALFMAIKSFDKIKSFTDWDTPLKFRDTAALEEVAKNKSDEIEFHRFIQYKFFTQWNKLKNYANKNGIKIIGDIPIYVALDSSDVWSNPNLFMLDNDLTPTLVAGCPPDTFSKGGQLWGNPLYRWDLMEQDDFSWWKFRISQMLKMYDIIRIDHFRGFESFYAIPYEDKDATGGHWKKGPDIKFFKEISSALGDNLPIIAEDLGFLTKDVEAMLKFTGYPGMKVLQFGFEGNYNNPYLPHNYIKNSVVYLGTHDNDTILGWAKTTSEENLEFAKKYLDIKKNDNINTKFINSALSSVADTVILTMADILGLDSKARINVPSTIGTNWKWRIKKGVLTDNLAADIYNITRLYCR